MTTEQHAWSRLGKSPRPRRKISIFGQGVFLALSLLALVTHSYAEAIWFLMICVWIEVASLSRHFPEGGS